MISYNYKCDHCGRETLIEDPNKMIFDWITITSKDGSKLFHNWPCAVNYAESKLKKGDTHHG